MPHDLDLARLVTVFAEIAAETTDPLAARRLLELADQLLTGADLGGDCQGGGDLPPGPLHAAQVDLPESE